jgi:hypothetical protein
VYADESGEGYPESHYRQGTGEETEETKEAKAVGIPEEHQIGRAHEERKRSTTLAEKDGCQGLLFQVWSCAWASCFDV